MEHGKCTACREWGLVGETLAGPMCCDCARQLDKECTKQIKKIDRQIPRREKKRR
jgi:hypothetical protein